MATAFADITALVRDALLTGPALAGGRVYRGRNRPLGLGEATAVCVNLTRASGEPIALSGDALQWSTTVLVTAYARGSASVDAEAAVDPLLQAVWQRLQTVSVPGALAITLDPAVQWAVDEGDAPVAEATVALRITHLTTGAALAAP